MTGKVESDKSKKLQKQSSIQVRDVDPKTAIFFSPRTLTSLVVGAFILYYWAGAFGQNEEQDPSHNFHRAVYGCAFVVIGISILQGPEPPFIRPHPIVWRAVHGVTLCYILLLTTILFLDADQARAFMANLEDGLGKELEERDYGGDCALWKPDGKLNTELLSETVDEFVVAHTLGWWAKALLLRNHFLLWSTSIGFELMEQTFKHILDNFNECWWDSWILDFSLCNAIGIFTGMLTVKYFGSRMYNWQGVSQQPNMLAVAKRAVLQFTPHTFERYQWFQFSTPTRTFLVFAMAMALLISEVNAFFLKTVLWVPPQSKLNVYRLGIWFFLGFPAIREYYHWIEEARDKTQPANKIGVFAWLAGCIILLELGIIFKFGGYLFKDKPWPKHVVISWSVALSVFALWLSIWQIRIWMTQSSTKKKTK